MARQRPPADRSGVTGFLAEVNDLAVTFHLADAPAGAVPPSEPAAAAPAGASPGDAAGAGTEPTAAPATRAAPGKRAAPRRAGKPRPAPAGGERAGRRRTRDAVGDALRVLDGEAATADPEPGPTASATPFQVPLTVLGGPERRRRRRGVPDESAFTRLEVEPERRRGTATGTRSSTVPVEPLPAAVAAADTAARRAVRLHGGSHAVEIGGRPWSLAAALETVAPARPPRRAEAGSGERRHLSSWLMTAVVALALLVAAGVFVASKVDYGQSAHVPFGLNGLKTTRDVSDQSGFPIGHYAEDVGHIDLVCDYVGAAPGDVIDFHVSLHPTTRGASDIEQPPYSHTFVESDGASGEIVLGYQPTEALFQPGTYTVSALRNGSVLGTTTFVIDPVKAGHARPPLVTQGPTARP